MRKRSLARELALQMLYQMDITGDARQECIAEFWRVRAEESVEDGVCEFASELVRGVIDKIKAIDIEISRHATNWQLGRMAVVDRNILRMSCFEIVFRQDIPAKVSINEAVELAKKFSGVEAGKFVNAILDKIKQAINK